MKLSTAVCSRLIALFTMIVIFASLAFSITSPGVKTDLNSYPEPPLPSLPSAGGKLIDPVFGSEIMRVTDETDGLSAGTAYSYWSTFNKDNTKLFIQANNSSGGAIVATFNPNTFTLVGKEIPPQLPTGGYFSSEFAMWSGINKSILFGFTPISSKLWEYNVDSHNYSLVHVLQ